MITRGCAVLFVGEQRKIKKSEKTERWKRVGAKSKKKHKKSVDVRLCGKKFITLRGAELYAEDCADK